MNQSEPANIALLVAAQKWQIIVFLGVGCLPARTCLDGKMYFSEYLNNKHCISLIFKNCFTNHLKCKLARSVAGGWDGQEESTPPPPVWLVCPWLDGKCISLILKYVFVQLSDQFSNVRSWKCCWLSRWGKYPPCGRQMWPCLDGKQPTNGPRRLSIYNYHTPVPTSASLLY